MVNQEDSDSIFFRSVKPYEFSRTTGVGVPSKVQKINKNAKVRFLPADEVVMLKSGTKAATQITHGNVVCPTNGRNSLSASSSSTQHQHAIQFSRSNDGEKLPRAFSCMKSTMGMTTSERAKDRPHKRVRFAVHAEQSSSSVISWPKIRSESKIRCAFKDEPPRDNSNGKIVSLPRKEFVRPGGSIDAPLPDKNIAASSSGSTENSAYNSACSLSVLKPSPISDSGISSHNGPSSSCTAVQERDLQRNLPKFQKCPHNGPALKVIWKGSFEVLDVSSEVRLYEGILAHPSAKISCKAYEFSKQIAEGLQFMMHPRCEFWPEIFQTDCPDRNDIALYFYPGKYERSKRQYSFLLKFIERQGLVLRSCIGHVELLVFPSKLLHVDHQKLDGSYFLWGVFRHPKCSTVPFKAGTLHGPVLPG